MTTILVQVADTSWTQQALHRACTLAWQYDARVVLLRLVSVPHASWLGAAMEELPPTTQERETLQGCKAVADTYGVELTVQSMQYISLDDAIVGAADLLNAQIVFVHLPESVFPYITKLRLWNLRRRLGAARRHLYILGEPPDATPWTSAVTAHTGKPSS